MTEQRVPRCAGRHLHLIATLGGKRIGPILQARKQSQRALQRPVG